MTVHRLVAATLVFLVVFPNRALAEPILLSAAELDGVTAGASAAGIADAQALGGATATTTGSGAHVRSGPAVTRVTATGKAGAAGTAFAGAETAALGATDAGGAATGAGAAVAPSGGAASTHTSLRLVDTPGANVSHVRSVAIVSGADGVAFAVADAGPGARTKTHVVSNPNRTRVMSFSHLVGR